MNPLKDTIAEQDALFDEEFRKYPNYTFEFPVPTTRGEPFPFFGEESELVTKIKAFMHTRDLAIENAVRAEVVERVEKLLKDFSIL